MTAIEAIIVSWMGTRRAASEKGMGEAPAVVAAPVATLMAASARSRLRSKSMRCAAVIAWSTPAGAPRKVASRSSCRPYAACPVNSSPIAIV